MKKTIFTIGRQYGSGGREIGKRLSQELGIPFYDRELLAEAAKDSSYSEKILKNFDEQPSRSLLYSMVMGTGGSIGNPAMPISMQAYLAQFRTIQKLAEECENGAVFIGRCSDYALRERDDVINIFIMADMDFRLERVRQYDDFPKDPKVKLEDMVRKVDKNRASYYSYYTEQKWGMAEHYNLCLDSSRIGIENCVKMIREYAGYAR